MFELVGKIVIYAISGIISIMLITWIFEQISYFIESCSEKYYLIRLFYALLMTSIYLLTIGFAYAYWRWLL